MATWMAQAAISRLAEDLDDLDTTIEFRRGFQRSCTRMLTQVASRQERVLFFHEAIPGFTVMAVKKTGWSLAGAEDAIDARRSRRATVETSAARPPDNNAPQAVDTLPRWDNDAWNTARTEVVEQVIGAFVRRTGDRVLTLEAQDLVLVLFPASDLKKNLQEMGFWV